MKPVSVFITASTEYFRGLPQKSRDYSRHSKKKGHYITYVLKECAGSTMLR